MRKIFIVVLIAFAVSCAPANISLGEFSTPLWLRGEWQSEYYKETPKVLIEYTNYFYKITEKEIVFKSAEETLNYTSFTNGNIQQSHIKEKWYVVHYKDKDDDSFMRYFRRNPTNENLLHVWGRDGVTYTYKRVEEAE